MRYPKFDYIRTPPEQIDRRGSPLHIPVVDGRCRPRGPRQPRIDLQRLQGIPVVLLDEDDTVSIGSRGVCYAKRALEILDRLRCRRRGVVEKGVSWNVGRTFFREEEVSTISTCCPSRTTSVRA
jgi:3-(3-hydroxy-phenyl)propionate hydroxylase